MATPEMGTAFERMTTDMGSKMTGYYYSLQSRYGDPRVYAMQQEQMAAEQAAVAHRQASTRSEALRAAYDKTREDVRRLHNSRMAPRPATRPGSSAHPPAPGRTPPPPGSAPAP